MDMREALFAVCPCLELVADVLIPRIGKTPAKDTDNDAKNFLLGIRRLVSKNGGLYKTMNRQNGILRILVHETGL